jgi:hypothetical protein
VKMWWRVITKEQLNDNSVKSRYFRHVSFPSFLLLAVGTPVAQRTRHGFGRAVFPQPALRLYSPSRAHGSCKNPVSRGLLGDVGLRDAELRSGAVEHLPGKLLRSPPRRLAM